MLPLCLAEGIKWWGCMSISREERLWKRLEAIHKRVQWMADEEVRGALLGGGAADGRFIAEKERLCDEAEKILDELEKGLKKNA